jgi:hypothetical protein
MWRSGRRCALYPFCRLTVPANLLVMPRAAFGAGHRPAGAAHGGGSTIGTAMIGFDHPRQIPPMNASVSQVVDIAGLAADQEAPRRHLMGRHRNMVPDWGTGVGCPLRNCRLTTSPGLPTMLPPVW